MSRILLTGKTGQIGWELQRALAPLGELAAPGRGEMDLADPDSIRSAIRQARPEIIVNAAAFTAVDEVETRVEQAMQVNATAPGIIAEEAKRSGALLIHYSTAHIFDGSSKHPYAEDDPPHPLNIYGRSKLEGERAVAGCGGRHLILRASWIYSLRSTNFLLAILKLARERGELGVVDDQVGTPTWARSIAEATAQIIKATGRMAPCAGIFHISATGSVSRFGFAQRIVAMARDVSGKQIPWAVVKTIKTAEYSLPARRPPYCVLSTEKMRREFGIELKNWESDLRKCLDELAAHGPEAYASR